MTHDPTEQLKAALLGLRRLKARVAELESGARAPIAIVGMACRFPGADDPDALWRLVREGRDAVGDVPRDRFDVDRYLGPADQPGTIVTRRGGFLGDVHGFDASWFRISPREARAMDPQQRLLLEVAWHALEDAGRTSGLEGSSTGVYLGVGLTDWAQRTLRHPDPTSIDVHDGTGAFGSIVAGRVSYALGLRGPSLALDTACSSSLVAVHLACQALRAGECDLALAGAVNLILSPDASIVFSRMGALAPDGRCKAFDAAADGYVRSEGVGVVVLKRLDAALRDGDRVLAVVRGSAVDHDGRSNGLTAPSGAAQRAVIEAALAQSGLSSADVGYVQAHGTGTPLGDPIEVEALAAAYGEGTAPLRIGSVKTNLGHAEVAAGMASLISAVQALRHREVPGNVHLTALNPRLRVDGTRLRFPTSTEPWTDALAAGVSSFGMSGTNAHVLLVPAPEPTLATGTVVVLPLSARDEGRLDDLRRATADALADDLARVGATLAARPAEAVRVAVVAGSSDAARAALAAAVPTTAGRVRLGLSLGEGVAEGAAFWADLAPFRDAVAEAGAELRRVVDRADGDAQLVGAWAIGRTLQAWGLVPHRVTGRGAGALAADVLRGATTLAEARASSGAPAAPLGDDVTDVLDTDTLRDPASLLAALGHLWTRGADVDWRAVQPGPVAGGPKTPFRHERFELPDPHEAARGARAVDPRVWAAEDVAFDGPVVRGGPWQVDDAGLATALAGATVEAALPPRCVRVVDGDAPPSAWLAAVAPAPGPLHLVVVGDGPGARALAALAAVRATEDPDGWGGLILADRRDVAAIAAALLRADGRDLRVRDGAIHTPVLRPGPRSTAAPTVRGTWWVTGGLGALGLRLARWLHARGASAVVLTSRRPPTAEAEAALDALRREGADVRVATGDVADPADVARIVAGLDDLRGVLHAAGVVDDRPLGRVGADDLAASLRPKLDAVRVLDAATRDRALDAFVVLGSASGALGIRGQGAYAAANAAASAVVAARRDAGLPGAYLAFGPWDAGMADADVRRRLHALGVDPLGTDEALDLLGARLHADDGALLVRLDPSRLVRTTGGRRIAALLDQPVAAPAPVSVGVRDTVLAAVRGALGHDGAIDPRAGLFDLGLDSMTAVALARDLEARLGRPIPPTAAFDHGTVDALVAWLEGGATAPVAAAAAPVDGPIAIVGAACRFPGGVADPEALWRLLVDGVDAIGPVPASRWDAAALGTAPEGGFLDGIEQFDPEFFGISPKEARALDPQQRLLLECGVEALERAGIPVDGLRDTPVGVFVGIGTSDYARRFDPLGGEVDLYAGTGNQPSFAAGRLAYVLGVRGPAVGLDTACSSSLVATHLACRALRDGECEVALAGGVHLILSPEGTVQLGALHALSPTGRCRTFDADADGYVRSEGAGIVVLKRLADAERDGDPILAVIRGSAVNHDGASAGLTVPSGEAQRELLATTLARAGVDAADVGFLEAHGTGTRLGDPIEVGAVREVYGRRPADRPLVLSSVKTHLGHAEIAAGVAGLLSAVLTLRHGTFAPHLHLRTPNPAMSLDFPVRVPTAAAPWTAARRLAAVSSFGLSGTNAHLVLEAASDEAAPSPSARTAHPLVLSATSEEAVRGLAGRVADALAEGAGLPDVGHTLATGRSGRPWRIGLAARDADEAVLRLRAVADGGAGARPSTASPVVWMFTGQGAQHPGMAQALYASEPAFRAVLDACDARIREVRGTSLLEALASDAVHDTAWTQPALFAVEVGLAALWRQVGPEPAALLGHSVGELAAACVAGVWSIEDALAIVEARGRLMATLPRTGGMAQVGLDEDAVRARLLPGLSLAAVNAPRTTVVSGDLDALDAFVATAEADGVAVRRLTVSHAFHSAAMDDVLDAFEATVATYPARTPRIPVLSNVTGRAETSALTTPGYWRRHLRETVRFADGVRAAPAGAVFVELGPRPALSAFARRIRPDAAIVPTLAPDGDAVEQVATSVAAAWAAGAEVDVGRWWDGEARRRVVLPSTPWRRQRCWVERPADVREVAVPGADVLLRTRWVAHAPRPTRSGPLHVVGPGAADLVAALAARGAEAREVDDVVAGELIDLRGRGVDDRGPAPVVAALATARAAVAAEARLTLVVDDTPVGDALVGLLRGLAEEHPARAGGAVRWDGRDADALARALLDAEPELRVRGGAVERPVLERTAGRPAASVSGAWWIPGGTGAVGLAVARLLADLGATRLVVSSRRGGSDDLDAALVTLRARVPVDVVACDVADPVAVRAVLDGLGDLGGVVHAAGALADRALVELTPEDVATVWSGKVGGAWALHDALVDRDVPLVLISSAAGALGWRGQAAYGAANAALDGLARLRRSEGRPAVSVAFGPWSGGGMATDGVRAAMAAAGMRALSPEVALGALRRALGGGDDVLAVDLAWDAWATRHPRARGRVEALVAAPPPVAVVARGGGDAVARQAVAVALGHPDPGALDASRGLFDLGLDSLTAVQLARELAARTGLDVPDTVAFDHPSIAALATWVDGSLGGATFEAEAPRAATREPIALVGLACRFPGGGDDPEAFWRLLLDGREAVRPVPPERWDVDAFYDPTPGKPGRTYVREGAFLDDVAGFEPGLFGISPREASRIDPQQRLLLELAWLALEQAGLAPDRLGGERCAVFVGIGGHDYERVIERAGPPGDDDAYTGTGNDPAFAAGRLAYVLGTQGPTLSLDTACSSSLVATHLGVEALRSGDAELALVGGVRLMTSPEETLRLSALRALSPKGRCATFDADADGYVRGEGAGVIVLERLSDARRRGHPVLAVIAGTAVNHDGASGGLTVPSGPAQETLLRRALADAGLSPGDVDALEAHGTGTPLGDPIELGAVAAVFGDRPTDRPLRVGSVKTNVGHLELAAGMAGLAKAVLALRHDTWPAHRHLARPSERLPRTAALAIPTEARPWPRDHRRVVGVSAFGLSGTNAHVLLADPPDTAPPTEPSRWERHVLPVTAATPEGLDAAARALADAVHDDVELADVAWTLATGRARLPHRRVVVAATAAEAREALRATGADGHVRKGAARPGVAWLFTGQGSQHPGMGRRLVDALPVVRDVLDRCDAGIRALRGEGLLPVMFGEGTRLSETAWTQPALYALEVAVATAWRSLGLVPDQLVGHSIGELAAATVAGVWSLEDGLRVVEARGRLMQALPRDGAMVAVAAGEEAVRARLVGDVDVAAVNAPDETVISGGRDAVLAVAAGFEREGVRVRELDVSHPFHSSRMEPMLAAFAEVVASVPRRLPEIPIVSGLTGRVEGEALLEVDFWVRQVREAVRFAPAVHAAVDGGARVLVEVGPHPVLAALGARTVSDPSLAWVPSLRRGVADDAAFLGAVARLHATTVDLDLAALHAGSRRASLPLPGTVFQRRRCWVDAAPPRPEIVPTSRVERTWVALGEPDAAPRRVALVGGSSLAAPLGVALAARGHAVVGLRDRPDRVVWLGALDAGAGIDDAHGALRRAIEGWLDLVRTVDVPVVVLTREAATTPTGAALQAIARVAALEQGARAGTLVDLDPDAEPRLVAAAVVEAREDEQRVTARGRLGLRWRPAPSPTPRPLGAGPALVTGGTGAVGLEVARRLVDDGVRALALVARRAPSADAEAAIAALRARGAKVEVVRADVGSEAARAVADATTALGAPPRIVVHAAGALDDAALSALDWPRIDAALGAKVDGALALARAVERLDALVLVSSATAWLGAHAQGAYAVANGWMDGFAGRLRAQGVPATSVAFGPWRGAGMAAEHLGAMASRGVRPLEPDAAAAALVAAVRGDAASVVLADADWARWRVVAEAGRPRPSLDVLAPPAPVPTAASRVERGRVRDVVRAAVADVLGLQPGELDPSAGFFDLGMDSLGTIALAERLTARLGRPLASTTVFDHPTVDRLAEHLAGIAAPAPVVATVAAPVDEPIAIVGMACRFPGAPDVDAFWRVLVDGRCVVGEAPRARWPGVDDLVDPNPGTPGRTYTTAGAFLDDIAGFDPRAFGISPREAEAMDPQQRLLLEVAYEALQDAAIARGGLSESSTGVWVGMGASEYDARFQRRLGTRSDAYSGTGNDTSFAAGRLAWLLGLHGPALTVNTACSAGLVSVHLAANALRDGECELALAGAVNLMVTPESHVRLAALGALSPTGACRAFDADADGYVRGEGAGVVVLERLSDARARGHRVLALLRGSAVNHGGPSSGLTAPSGRAQTRLLQQAWARAGITPDDLGYVEAHGTGTKLGDPIEARALLAALGDRRRPLRIGSAKTNVGHLELAAGMVGLIKTVLALRHGVVPAHLHLRRRNPEIPEDAPLELPARSVPWEGPRIAGVSSFGLSGTNAHVVLEAAPEPPVRAPSSSRARVVPLAAPTATARDALAVAVAERLAEAPLVDVALTAGLGRSEGRHRVAVVGTDASDVAIALRGGARGGRFTGEAPLDPPKVAFLFPGQGAVATAGELMAASPRFREAVDEVDAVIAPAWGTSVAALLRGGDGLERVELAAPALFAFEVAMARLWADVGVVPDAVLGHGVGEVAAACVAGVWSLEDAARFVVARTHALAATPPGRMAVVRATEERVRAALGGRSDVAIAAVNAPDEVVVSGSDAGVDAALAALPGVTALPVPGRVAWHSPLVASAVPALRAAAAATTFRAPATIVVSSRTGTADDASFGTADGQAARAAEAVRFGDGVRALAASGVTLLVEVGPHPLLLGAARRAVDPRGLAFLSSHRADRGWDTFLESVAAAWVRGVGVDFARVAGDGGRRVALPTTPWERVRCWVDDDPRPSLARPEPAPAAVRVEPVELIATTVAELLGVPVADLDRRRPLAWQGFDSIMATELKRRVDDALHVDLPAGEVVSGPSVVELADVVASLARRP